MTSSSRAVVEHDFLRLSGRINSHRSSSFRGIQGAITRLDPNLVRSVMGIPRGPPSRPVAPPIPALSPASMPVDERPPATAPLTVFYNGTVTVFHVGPGEAESIMKIADEGNAAKERVSNTRLNGADDGMRPESGLPMARKISFQRFLEKRNRRTPADAPDADENEEASSAVKKGKIEFT